MKILNFGSLNIDYVYKVDEFVREGETKSAKSRKVFAGGKGLNQTVAMCRAGLKVYHAGKTGADGAILIETLHDAGADTSFIIQDGNLASGHAIIQTDSKGRNCILIHGGGNREITEQEVDRVLANFGEGDLMVLQNEISCLPYIARAATKRKIKIAYNPAPMDQAAKEVDLRLVDVLIVNETEGKVLTGKADPQEILTELERFNDGACIVLTMGGDGSYARYGSKTFYQPAVRVETVDTTGAGDTFFGYFLSAYVRGDAIEKCLLLAARAAALAVSREGAATAIPFLSELA